MPTPETALQALDDEYHEYVEHLLKQLAASHWIAPRLLPYQGMQAELDDGSQLHGRLLVAADSRFSSVRRAMGVAADAVTLLARSPSLSWYWVYVNRWRDISLRLKNFCRNILLLFSSDIHWIILQNDYLKK